MKGKKNWIGGIKGGIEEKQNISKMADEKGAMRKREI